MRKVNVVNVADVEVEPFIFHDFIHRSDTGAETKKRDAVKVSKKELRHLAKEMGLNYNEEALTAVKKLLEAYLAQRVEA